MLRFRSALNIFTAEGMPRQMQGGPLSTAVSLRFPSRKFPQRPQR